MLQPKSKLPWKVEVSTEVSYDGSTYVINSSDNNANGDNEVLCDRTYYNYAPTKQDAKYIVQACNNFPKAVDLLNKIIHESFIETEFDEEIEEFLKSLEKDG